MMLACIITGRPARTPEETEPDEDGILMGFMYERDHNDDYGGSEMMAVVRVGNALLLKTVHPSRIKFPPSFRL